MDQTACQMLQLLLCSKGVVVLENAPQVLSSVELHHWEGRAELSLRVVPAMSNGFSTSSFGSTF